MASLMMNDLAVLPKSINKLRDTWERRGKEWKLFDRVCMTEEQSISLANKISDSAYLSSEYLMRPSIPEFTVLVEDEGRKENTYICYRKSLLTENDFADPENKDISRRIIPTVDAYIYINNRGTRCNMIVTLAKADLVLKGKTITTSAQFLAYSNGNDAGFYQSIGNGKYFKDFLCTIKLIYLAVQMLSVERPEITAAETVREDCHTTVKKKGKIKQVRKTRFIKVVRITDDTVNSVLTGRHHEITCPCWGVAGHWRTYKKTGKRVWIGPYRKGKKRNDPDAYESKEYQIPKEDY